MNTVATFGKWKMATRRIKIQYVGFLLYLKHTEVKTSGEECKRCCCSVLAVLSLQRSCCRCECC